MCVLGKRFLEKPCGGLCTSLGRAGWNVGTLNVPAPGKGARLQGAQLPVVGRGRREEMLGSFPDNRLYLEVH